MTAIQASQASQAIDPGYAEEYAWSNPTRWSQSQGPKILTVLLAPAAWTAMGVYAGLVFLAYGYVATRQAIVGR